MSRTIISDKRTRVNAIPFRASWYSNYSSTIVGGQLLDGNADGDLKTFADGGSAQVRIPVPAKGDLIEARLFINAVFPVTGAAGFRCYIGEYDTDGLTPLTKTSAQIGEHYKILTGSSESFYYPSQGNLFVDGLNLMPLIKKRGEAGFSEDGFILGLELSIKDNPTDFVLFDFVVDCTTQIAEVRK